MAEETQSSGLATLGRIVSVLGYLWVVVFFLNRAGLFAELGINLGDLGGNIIPAFILIGVGRAMRRRATPKTDEPESPRPVVLRPGQEVAAKPRPDVAASPTNPKPKPKPEPLKQTRTEVAKNLEQVLADMEGEAVDTVDSGVETGAALEALDVAPKTSAEMLEEAKHQFDVQADES